MITNAGLLQTPSPTLDRAGLRSIADLYAERLRLTPQAEAGRFFDAQTQAWSSQSWTELAESARAFAANLREAGLQAGDRIAMQLPNGPDWLALDWAAHSLGLVTVALFADETAAGTSALLEDSGARLLIGRDLVVRTVVDGGAKFTDVDALVSLRAGGQGEDRRVRPLASFLRREEALRASPAGGADLATIVYTSGATGRPKGVMLSHEALIANAFAVQEAVRYCSDDRLFSNLPLAHLFGRVAWVYAAIVSGASVLFGRGAGFGADDVVTQRPTVLIGAPRLFERIHGVVMQELEQGSGTRRALFRLAVETGWAASRPGAGMIKGHLLPTVFARRAGAALRERLGGRVRLAVSGGAALSPQIGRTFNALGIPLLQGYGLTEAGPVVCVNRADDVDPSSVGKPLQGVETRIEANGELFVRSPSVMLGYWNDEAGTRQVLDPSGWLRTGDKVSRLDTDRIYLIGRFKELIITATGEKASPADIESRLRELPLVEQVMVVGEARPYLTALVVPKPGPLAMLRAEIGLNDGDYSVAARDAIESVLLQRCQETLQNAPRNHWIVKVALVFEHWTPANGQLTATHKLRRCEIVRAQAEHVDRLYEGHYLVPATDCSNNALS